MDEAQTTGVHTSSKNSALAGAIMNLVLAQAFPGDEWVPLGLLLIASGFVLGALARIFLVFRHGKGWALGFGTAGIVFGLVNVLLLVFVHTRESAIISLLGLMADPSTAVIVLGPTALGAVGVSVACWRRRTIAGEGTSQPRGT